MKMNAPHTVLIAVDIEGVANVWRVEQTQAGNAEYERARRWMTHEASAAVRGAFAGGAQRVLVNDSHGHFCNLLADELDARAELIQGKPRRLGMMAGVDEPGMAGVLLIGWHARAKTQGVLAHSTNSFAFARVWLEGLPHGPHLRQEVGELGLYTLLAAELGVPVWMVSGCDITAHEAQQAPLSLPEHACATVKWSAGARTGRSLSPVQAQALIEHTAAHQVRLGLQAPTPPTLRPATPLRLVVQCQTPALADLFELWPTIQRENADTLTLNAQSVQDCVRSLNALSAMSSALR